MNIPQNTTMKNRPKSARAAAARYRRRVERNEIADLRRAIHTDPATGHARTINIRHS